MCFLQWILLISGVRKKTKYSLDNDSTVFVRLETLRYKIEFYYFALILTPLNVFDRNLEFDKRKSTLYFAFWSAYSFSEYFLQQNFVQKVQSNKV